MDLYGTIPLPVCMYRLRVRQAGGSGAQDDKKEKLVLWTYYETENQKISMDELANGFNQSQKEYELTWEYHIR